MSAKPPVTPIPQPAPAPVAQPTPAAPPALTPHPAPTGEYMVPSYRVREQTEKFRAAHQRATQLATELETLRTQVETLTPNANRAQELEAALDKHKSTSARRIALARLSSDRPALAHDSIQDFLLSGYDAATAGQDEPVPFTDWITAVEEANDPLYAPHLKRAAGPDPRAAQMTTLFSAVDAGTMTPEQAVEAFTAALEGQGEQPAAALTPVQQLATLLQQMSAGGGATPPQTLTGDPNAGTRPPAAPVKTYTTADLARIRQQNGGRLPAAVRQAMMHSMKQSGAIK